MKQLFRKAPFIKALRLSPMAAAIYDTCQQLFMATTISAYCYAIEGTRVYLVIITHVWCKLIGTDNS